MLNEPEKEKQPVDDGVDAESGFETAEDIAGESHAEAVAEAEGPGEKREPAGDGEEPAGEDAKPAEPDWRTLYARAMADFDNFRKRTERDREDLFKGAAAGIIKDLLPIVDNLALALSKVPDASDPFVQGVQLVYDGFLKALGAHGAVPIDAKGEPFDANFHEAIAKVPGNGVAEDVVLEEVKRGWLLNGKLLRSAQVVVSAG